MKTDGERMSLKVLESAIKDKKMICPKCNQSVTKYDKYIDMCGSVWDGAGDSGMDTKGSMVTLICGNGSCGWEERTEFWESYIEE